MTRILPLLAAALLSGCAAIPAGTMGGRVWPIYKTIHIESSPPGARVIFDTHEGTMLACAATPCDFDAPDAFGFFSKYTLRATLEGYVTQEQTWTEKWLWDAQEVIPNEVVFKLERQNREE